MKGLYLLLLTLLLTGNILAQSAQERKCAAQTLHTSKLESDPSYKARYKQIQEMTKEFELQRQFSRVSSSTTVREIPVYVHVIYDENKPEQNISETQIASQIEVLNKDFRALNSDVTEVPSEFAGVVADYQLIFKLEGITRKSSAVTAWTSDDKMKNEATGGIAPITPETHLNIWVCSLSNDLLGYAQFPGGSSSTDGVVVGPGFFGSSEYDSDNNFYLAESYDKGRTTTHEIGHYLNLYHIWGDGGCSVDDEVADTPPAAKENDGCPAYPTKSCEENTDYTSDMFMNYMDYVNDACMFMFSEGQKTRSYALFEAGGFRENLGTVLDGCDLEAPTGLSLSSKSETSLSLTWNNVSGADSYNIWVNGKLVNSTTNSVVLTALERGRIYDIKVSANCTAGGAGVYSDFKSFNTDGCFDGPITFTFKTDDYGVETSWALSYNGTIVQTDSITYDNNTTYTGTFAFGSGSYKFEIFDASGDGFCCDYGEGSYSLVDSGGRTIASGGKFGSSESVSFCVEQAPCAAFDFAAVDVSHINCAEVEDGQLLISVSGGEAPYSYSLNGATPSASNIFDGLAAGEYTIEVIDNSGCQIETAATIKSPTPLEVSAEVTSSTSIKGNGVIALTVSGGTAAYTYQWSNEENTATIENLEVGEYTVIITDENGCTLEDVFQVGGITANDNSMEEAFIVFPNPAKDVIRLMQTGKSTQLKIYNANGMLMLDQKIAGEESGIDVSEWSAGLYFIRLNNRNSFQKFLKE